MKSKSIKYVDFSSKLMKILGLFFVLFFSMSEIAFAQYLTISSCNNYNLGSNLGHQVPGIYPVFPVFNFTVFNMTVTQSSDLAFYKNLCSDKNNVFYGLNASLQTCSSFVPPGTLSNAAWANTGLSEQNLTSNIMIMNDSNFTYIPVNATSKELTVFYPSHPGFQNSLNKIVNASNSEDVLNFTFYGLALNNTAQPPCYFPVYLNDQNFSIIVNSTSINNSLILNQNQNETFNLDNSTGSWVLNTFFSSKSFYYEYNGSLPASFKIMVERLDKPIEITQLYIKNISLLINFSEVKSNGLGVVYSNTQPELLNEANPFDLKFDYNGWIVELSTGLPEISGFDSTFNDSYNVSVINVTITPVVGYIKRGFQYAENIFDRLLHPAVTPIKAKDNGKNQLTGTNLAKELYTVNIQKCINNIKSYSGETCSDISSCRSFYGELQFNTKFPQYANYQTCDGYARGVSDYTG